MKNKRFGFTLIELLVVIAIIAILAAILFPVFARAQARGKQATCASNLQQLDKAIKFYCSDNGDKYPMAYEWNAGQPTIVTALYPKYMPSNKAFICPSDFGDTASKTNSYGNVYGTSYGYPGLPSYRPVSSTGFCAYPYIAGLSMSNPVPNDITDASKFSLRTLWIWRLPLSKRPQLFDHNPWHQFTGLKVSGDRFSAEGFNNLIFCDGHIAPMQYQTYLVLLGFKDGPHP